MPAYKDKKKGTWYASFYYEDWNGVRKKKMKRNFATKKEALAWERQFLLQRAADPNMKFSSFVELYLADKKDRIKENTKVTKDNVIQTKILPYFGEKPLADIQARDVIAWQNELLNYRDEKGEPYSRTYLNKIHSQLSAIFNHAVRYYNLRENPAKKAGGIGPDNQKEMDFWTKEEYLQFADVMMDKPVAFYAFEMLYWCGLREGELLALTPADFDLEKGTVSITKSYQRLHGKDVITTPKTPKSVRVVSMPPSLVEEMREYISSFYGIKPDDRLFEFTKYFLHHEMDRGSREAGVKRIRIHDLRHSHVSLLINMGVSVEAIAARVGHESIYITYRYAHLFPSKQLEMVQLLEGQRKEGA